MLTRPDKMKLHTLLGSYPNAVAMKDGRVKSDLVEARSQTRSPRSMGSEGAVGLSSGMGR